LKQQALSVETRGDMQNRHVYTLPEVKVEVVHPIENTDFCARCTRLRVTSDGKLKPCLMVNNNLVDILSAIRRGATDEDLKELFVKAVKRREPFYKPGRAD
jgi:cyclic pyranopterin phosphate synthase